MRLGFGLLCLQVSSAFAGTVTVFSDLNGSDGFFTNAGYAIYESQQIAANFTPTSSGLLSSIRIAFHQFGAAPATDPIIVTLRGAGADPTGPVLESWTVPAADVIAAPWAGLITLTSLLQPVLLTSTGYWLRADSVATLFSNYNWNVNDHTPMMLGLMANNPYDPGTGWYTQGMRTPAFDVSADETVPEPLSLALVAGGLAALALRRRVRRS